MTATIWTALAVVCETFNQCFHLAIYLRLKHHQKVFAGNQIFVKDHELTEQIIRANFLQSIIPLIIQGPYLVTVVLRYLKISVWTSNATLTEYLVFMVLTFISETIPSLAFLLNAVADPLCIICIIKSYRNVWTSIKPNTVPIRFLCFIIAILLNMLFMIVAVSFGVVRLLSQSEQLTL